MAIAASALLQEHNAWRDIVIEMVPRWRAAIKARQHSKLGPYATDSVWNWGCNHTVKTHQLVSVTFIYNTGEQTHRQTRNHKDRRPSAKLAAYAKPLMLSTVRKKEKREGRRD